MGFPAKRTGNVNSETIHHWKHGLRLVSWFLKKKHSPHNLLPMFYVAQNRNIKSYIYIYIYKLHILLITSNYYIIHAYYIYIYIYIKLRVFFNLKISPSHRQWKTVSICFPPAGAVRDSVEAAQRTCTVELPKWPSFCIGKSRVFLGGDLPKVEVIRALGIYSIYNIHMIGSVIISSLK